MEAPALPATNPAHQSLVEATLRDPRLFFPQPIAFLLFLRGNLLPFKLGNVDNLHLEHQREVIHGSKRHELPPKRMRGVGGTVDRDAASLRGDQRWFRTKKRRTLLGRRKEERVAREQMEPPIDPLTDEKLFRVRAHSDCRFFGGFLPSFFFSYA